MCPCVEEEEEEEEGELGEEERERDRDRETKSEGMRERIPGEKRVYECVWSHHTTQHTLTG